MSALTKSFQYIRRSPYQAFTAISIMVLTFLVGGLFFLAGYSSTLALRYFESKPQLVIFFNDTKEKSEIDTLAQKLINTGKVAKAIYVSKEEALNLYKEWYKNDPLLLEMVTADILPQSLEVSAHEAKDLEVLAAMVRDEQGIEDIQYQADVVRSLVSWTSMIRSVGIVLVGFLVIESMFVMLTVIGMKIAMRKEEIEILRLIGATNWYIGKPFLIEGILYGLIGALLALLIGLGGLLYVSPILKSLLVGIPFDPYTPVFLGAYSAGMLLSGIMLGSLGAAFALLRYLR